ncbi:MAG: FAD:protein FMN transferase [Acidiferrobacterales bacterium]
MPSLNDGKPISLDLDQVPIGIESDWFRSHRRRLASAVCANDCQSRLRPSLRYKALGALLLLSLMSIAYSNDESVFKTQLSVFGTRVDILIWGVEPALAKQAEDIIAADFKRIHHDWNAWKPGTLVRLNQALAARESLSVDNSLLALIRESKRLYRSSNGLFNPAIGRLIALWGFQRDIPPRGPPPDGRAIAELISKHPTMEDIIIRGNRISSRNPAVQLDFGGIAKGYAVDLAIQRLRELGIRNAIVNAGGDLRAIGSRGPRPWRVGIRHPQGRGILAWLETNGDESIFTSGNYERYREHAGVRYTHIIDPRTGMPVKEVVSATVVDENGALADAAATALSVAGISSWQKISRQMGVGTVMLVDSKGTVYLTRSMADRIHYSGVKPKQVVVDIFP